ncbi:MAG: GAF domain-containing protein, partial [Chloroflexia bacterium]|nr:GAF domain-containing protein [Chloroflexia bacterium]
MSNLLSPFSAFLVPDLGSTIIKLLFQQLQRLHWILLLGGLFLLALLAAILAYALRQSRANWQSANRRLIRLNQASQTLSSTLDLDQVLVTFLEQVRQLLDVTACSVWLVDPQSGELVCRQAGGPRGELVRGWRLAPGEGVVGWVIQHGKSIVVPDVRTEALHFPGIDRQTGLDIRSVVGLPLRIPQRIIGALEVVDTAPHRFSTNDVLLLESLAISAAIAIENAHLYQQAYQEISQRKEAEQALRESESRYRNLVDGVPVGIFQSTPEGKILDANPAYVQMLGYPDRETLLDTPAAELYLDPEDRARWCTLIERQGVVRSFEAKLRRYDGTTIWVRESAHTVRDNQGQALYYEGAMEDITEQKLAAQKIQRQTETLAALHETALALATQQELPDLLRAIVARAVELLRAKGGGIYLYRSESHDLELALTYNLDDNQVGAVLQPGEGLSGEVLRTGQPL